MKFVGSKWFSWSTFVPSDTGLGIPYGISLFTTLSFISKSLCDQGRVKKIALNKVPDDEFVEFILNSDVNFSSRELSGHSGLLEHDDVTIKNFHHVQYFGDIFVGTPTQKFRVVFDTANTKSWIPGRYCYHNCEEEPNFMSRNKVMFDESLSQSYVGSKTPFKMKYQTGPVSGKFGQDTVTIGDLHVKNQTFGIISHTGGLGLTYSLGRFDGVLGLGFSASISPKKEPTLLENAMNQGLLENPIFAFYLGGDGNGELTIGGVDDTKYMGSFNKIKLFTAKFWQFPLDSVHVGNNKIASQTTAVLDSGASFIVGPTSRIAELARSIGARPLGTKYVIDCDKIDSLPEISFVIGGRSYLLEGEDVVFQAGNICLLALSTLDRKGEVRPKWILGDVFMRKFYTMFDLKNREIGIARLA